MGDRGINSFTGSGQVESDVEWGTTSQGAECCSFTLAMEDKGRRVTRARVNVYGGLVRVCRARSLRRGVYIVVEGELMNRGSELTEVRAKNLAIPTTR